MHPPMSSSRNVVAALVLALSALAAPAGAQLTEAQSVGLVKAATKAQGKVLKATGKSALIALDVALDAIEGSLGDQSPATPVVLDVGNAAVALLDTLDAALEAAIRAVDETAKDSLEALADGGDLAGQFPRAFYFGTGGVLDASRTALVKDAVKVRDAARKRIGKTIEKAESMAGIGLAVTLELPTVVRGESVNQDQKVGLALGARLDLLVAGSSLDVLSDGIIFAAGLTDISNADVELTVVLGPGIVDTLTIDVAPGSRRFTAVLSDDFTGFDEGNALVGTTQSGSIVGSAAEIGVR